MQLSLSPPFLFINKVLYISFHKERIPWISIPAPPEVSKEGKINIFKCFECSLVVFCLLDEILFDRYVVSFALSAAITYFTYHERLLEIFCQILESCQNRLPCFYDIRHTRILYILSKRIICINSDNIHIPPPLLMSFLTSVFIQVSPVRAISKLTTIHISYFTYKIYPMFRLS